MQLEGIDILAAARLVLAEPDPHKKAELTNAIVPLWQEGKIGLPGPGSSHPVPPSRPARDPNKVRGGGGGSSKRHACTLQSLPA